MTSNTSIYINTHIYLNLFELRIFSRVQTTIRAELKPNTTINFRKMFQGQRRKNRRSWNTDGGCDNVFLKVVWGG